MLKIALTLFLINILIWLGVGVAYIIGSIYFMHTDTFLNSNKSWDLLDIRSNIPILDHLTSIAEISSIFSVLIVGLMIAGFGIYLIISVLICMITSL